jgi:RNA polymerase sigma-70 factor (family 1)
LQPNQLFNISTNQHIDDILLLPGLKSGDNDAFKQLVALYQERVFNTAISMVQDHGMAEDITQETFIMVYKSILSFNEKSSMSTWIYRITVNKCLDHLRAANRKKRAGIFSGLFSDSATPPEQPNFEHPGVQLERREQARYLFAAIETLPHNQKIVFVLAHIEELSQKEIAEIMNLSVKAVESLIQRAKVNLRKKLSDIYDRRKM